MSLAVLAQDMASKGRNGDSMLVHMTPGEVAGLHALALKHGGSLTINPETGLHEANFLKSLLPIIAGFALGPAGFGLVSSALGAGAVVGGITGLATGSLSKGLMAGLGAYGGFGIGQSLMGAGADSLTRSALSVEGALPSVDNITQVTGEGYGGSAANYSDQVNSAVKAASDASRAMPKADLLSQGLSSVANDPMGFAKQNWAPLAAAAAPIVADQMVPTTTKTATPTDTGNIRKFSFDPYSQRYTPQGVFPAAGYKGGMAGGGLTGGIVALAGGFTPQQFKEQMYAGGADDTAATRRGLELASQAGLNAVDTTNLWNSALGTKFTPDDYSAVMRQYNIAAPTANTDFVKSLATDTSTAADFGREVGAKGLSTQDVNAALASSGLSGAAQFALTNQNIGSAANTAETYGGIKGLSNNINYWLAQNPGASANAVLDEMKKYDLTDEDFKRATGKTVAQYTTGPITEVVTPAIGIGGGTGAVVNENGTITQTALGDTNKITTVKKDDAGNVVLDSAGQPVTETKVMPTRTVDDITNLYTTGGGSTGYTVNAPKTMKEFDTRFNKLRPGSDSESAYKYLMGQGAYPTHSNVGEIMKPYSEAVLGIPQDIRTKKYLYDNKTRKMVLNPDYVPMSFDTKGVQSYGLSQSDISKYLKANNQASDADIYSWAVENNVTPEQIAEANNADIAVIRAKYAAAKKATAGTTGTVDVTNKANKPSTDPGSRNEWLWDDASNKWIISEIQTAANGGMMGYAMGGLGNLGGYSDGGRLLKGPGDGVSDSIPATIGQKQQPARLADGEFVIPARIVSELGNGSTDAGAKKLYAMMDRVQRARGKTTGKNKVAANSRAEKYLPA